MKTAYVSLHTVKPVSQTDGEVSYEGYHRMKVVYGENFGDTPVDLYFPEILADTDAEISYICIGEAEFGDGPVLTVVHSMPYIKVKAGNKPRIVIVNIPPDGLPKELNPIARVVYNLVSSGEIRAEDLHPKLYEAVNSALTLVGVNVIPVIRTGAADMYGKLSEMPSFNDFSTRIQ